MRAGPLVADEERPAVAKILSRSLCPNSNRLAYRVVPSSEEPVEQISILIWCVHERCLRVQERLITVVVASWTVVLNVQSTRE